MVEALTEKRLLGACEDSMVVGNTPCTPLFQRSEFFTSPSASLCKRVVDGKTCW